MFWSMDPKTIHPWPICGQSAFIVISAAVDADVFIVIFRVGFGNAGPASNEITFNTADSTLKESLSAPSIIYSSYDPVTIKSHRKDSTPDLIVFDNWTFADLGVIPED